jgi:hypothetical protein
MSRKKVYNVDRSVVDASTLAINDDWAAYLNGCDKDYVLLSHIPFIHSLVRIIYDGGNYRILVG